MSGAPAALAALAVAAVVGVGCGGSGKGAQEPASKDACDQYAGAMVPFLQQFDAALDAFHTEQASGDAKRAGTAAGDLADALAGTLPRLRSTSSDDARLRQAHADLVAAIEELTAALRQLAGAYQLGDTSLGERADERLRGAFQRWNHAVQDIRAVCG